MTFEFGSLQSVGQINGCSLWRPVADEIAAGVDPLGVLAADSSALVVGDVVVDGGPMAGEAGALLQEDEPAAEASAGQATQTGWAARERSDL